MRASLVALLSLLLLTACDSTRSLKDLRQAAPVADPYMAALASEYRSFSEEKLGSYDWWSSKYFADKGLMCAYGRDIEPEQPAQWGITKQEFEEARGRLMEAVAANRASMPETAAVAVADFDRWVELENNGWDTARIDAARDMFYVTLDELENPLAAEEPIASGAPRKQRAAEKPIPSVAETTSAILYFPFDTDSLTETARLALNEMLKYIREAGPVTVSLNGHADRVGGDAYNMTLSERRAKFVMKTLEEAGVPPAQIEYFAFGETDPKVPTDDNVAEPNNRRVEIFLE